MASIIENWITLPGRICICIIGYFLPAITENERASEMYVKAYSVLSYASAFMSIMGGHSKFLINLVGETYTVFNPTLSKTVPSTQLGVDVANVILVIVFILMAFACAVIAVSLITGFLTGIVIHLLNPMLETIIVQNIFTVLLICGFDILATLLLFQIK